MKKFRLNDGSSYDLNYEIYSNILPENTLFLHGNVASSRWWHPSRDIWTQAAARKNQKGSMILGNLRGCGGSSAPRQQDINADVFAQDHISLIENLNLGPVHLVGHSAGGFIATLMLAKAPHLFKKAILLDPVGAHGVQFEPSMEAAFELMKTNKNLVATTIGNTIYQNDPSAGFFRNIIVEDAFYAVNTVGAGVIKALNRYDMKLKCPNIQHKVLVLHGEHDFLLPEKDSKELAEMMPNAQFRSISDQGHCMNVENPEDFVDIVNDFLAD